MFVPVISATSTLSSSHTVRSLISALATNVVCIYTSVCPHVCIKISRLEKKEWGHFWKRTLFLEKLPSISSAVPRNLFGHNPCQTTRCRIISNTTVLLKEKEAKRYTIRREKKPGNISPGCVFLCLSVCSSTESSLLAHQPAIVGISSSSSTCCDGKCSMIHCLAQSARISLRLTPQQKQQHLFGARVYRGHTYYFVPRHVFIS